MSTGQKIKKYRKLRKLTQNELGRAVGLTESAIRNYEHDYRTPNEDQVRAIARELNVPVAALEDYEISSAREALEALFRLEDAFGLKPDGSGCLVIDPKAKGAQKIAIALKAWRDVLDEVESGDMTEEEYELWKVSLHA
ncbi:helix-turn-helix domain-containing protein [Adlercreutzia sp. ZJ473]|uniref:helix-turn-helix domain-containing protein n=1 Tax=Adlercreutzia sp. ZJ473 TaxID=2722822 RepID=UPI0015525E0C|nr:helix-turn-helix transcriptional regulator [Adlercreutzia sp. ZJ473]